MDDKPQVTKYGILDVQVCVPHDWTNEQIRAFAESKYPCGTKHGWQICTDPELLGDDPIYNPCLERTGFVHVMLEA